LSRDLFNQSRIAEGQTGVQKLVRGKSVAELTTPDMSTLTKWRAERGLSAQLRARAACL
jgi:hypothetical protein